MRGIFRARRMDNEEWIEGSLITGVFLCNGQDISYILCPEKADYDCFEDFSEEGENGIFEVNPETLCQSTGLTDKNGTKIFEGDIVTLNDEDEKFIVEWDPDSARFILRGETFTTDFDSYWGYQTEIIGNAFDNETYK